MSEDDNSPAAGNGDGEESGNQKTVLYCFTREAMRAEDLEAIRDALDDEGFSLTTGDEGENLMVQRPAETGSGVDVDSILG